MSVDMWTISVDVNGCLLINVVQRPWPDVS